MKKSINRILCLLCAAALLIQLASPAIAAQGGRSGENLALHKVATATYEQMSSDYQAFAGNAVDGDYNSRWSTFGGPALPAAIQVDLGAECELDSIATYWFGAGRTYTYSVYVTNQPMIVDHVMQTGVSPIAAGLKGSGSGSASSPTVPGKPGTVRTEYAFPAKATGRYLTIECTQVAGSSAAVLWELEANGVQIGETQQASIAKIPSFTERKVALGTGKDQVSLPQTATVSLDNGTKRQLGLNWDCSDYRQDVAGTYEFIGTPVLPAEGGIANPENRTARAQVTVCEQEDLNGRQSVNLCEGWSFQQGTLLGAEAADYNDALWGEVDIPHTWNALDGQDGGNNYYRGDGWYRKILDWNDSYAGKQVALEFLGANMQADVYVNGGLIGTHKGGYTAFRFDITDALIPGEENVIAVKVNNQQVQEIAPISADFTFFGGIYREVSLVVTNPVHIDTADYGSSGLYLTQTNVSKERADLNIRASIVNDAPQEKTVRVVAALRQPEEFCEIEEVAHPEFDPAQMVGSEIVAEREMTLTIPAGGSAAFEQDVTVQNPHLWNGKIDPYRYQVDLQVIEDGEKIDSQTGFVGFRFYTVDYDSGFYLNGESYPLRGVSRHQDREDMGNALTQKEHDEDFGLIYEMGVNALRLAHYPQAPYFYDLCDRYGIVVWAEIPFVNNVGGSGSYDAPNADRQAFFDVTKQQLVELIRQQYNRPSICFWGLQNEVLAYNEAMPQFMQELNDLAHREDPTRLTTQATDKSAAQAWASDLIAWNRYPGWYFGVKEDMGADLDTNHAADSRPFAISEYGVGANIEHHLDKATNADKNMSVQSEEYQNICHESFVRQIDERPYLWATFVWNMFDFASDGRSEGGLKGINTKGLVTHDRQTKKDSFYLYKANWSSEPFVYITSRRNAVRENSPIEIKGYSNCDEVTLFVNGKTVGSLTQEALAQQTVFVWENVPLSNGENTVEMQARKDGKVYTDTVVWNKEKSSSTEISSEILKVDDTAKTIALSREAKAEQLGELIRSYDATLALFESDAATPVTSGKIVPGMLLKVTSEDGEQSDWYTFVQACLSTGKPIKAGSYQNNKDGNNPPTYANDGDSSTRWAAGLTEDGTSTTYPQWICVDLEEVFTLSRVDISWFQSSTQRKYFYTVSVSEDGEHFTPVIDRTSNNTSGLVSDVLGEVKGRFVRIDVSGNSNWPGNKSSAASIFEINVYGEAVPVDKDRLGELYSRCHEMQNDNYTPASWDVFVRALGQAQRALENPDASQQEVDAAHTALSDAEQALRKAADKAALNKAITDAQALRRDDYTEPSWAKLQEALQTAVALSENPNAEQEAADSAADSLSAAIRQLEPVTPDPSGTKKDILKAVLRYAQQAKTGEEYAHVIASVKKSFDAALTAAQTADQNEDATQQEIDAAWTALLREIHKLGFQAGNKDTLQAMAQRAQEIQQTLDLYVDGAAKDALPAALTAAQGVLADGDALQKDVSDAEKALLEAMTGLRFRADKSVLEQVLNEANSIDPKQYTPESVAALNRAIECGQAVAGDGQATPEEVELAVSGIRDAMQSLVAVRAGAAAENTTHTRNAATSESLPIAACTAMGVAALVLRRKRR